MKCKFKSGKVSIFICQMNENWTLSPGGEDSEIFLVAPTPGGQFIVSTECTCVWSLIQWVSLVCLQKEKSKWVVGPFFREMIRQCIFIWEHQRITKSSDVNLYVLTPKYLHYVEKQVRCMLVLFYL